MHPRELLLSTVCYVGLASAGYAHHGGGAYFAPDQVVGPISGTATDFSFNFPHVSFSLDVPDEQGNLVSHSMSIRWTPTVLRRIGWRRNTIEPGDKLTVTFVPHKLDPTIGALRTLAINDLPMAIEPPADEPE
jgi:hypothetical protein